MRKCGGGGDWRRHYSIPVDYSTDDLRPSLCCCCIGPVIRWLAWKSVFGDDSFPDVTTLLLSVTAVLSRWLKLQRIEGEMANLNVMAIWLWKSIVLNADEEAGQLMAMFEEMKKRQQWPVISASIGNINVISRRIGNQRSPINEMPIRRRGGGEACGGGGVCGVAAGGDSAARNVISGGNDGWLISLIIVW